MNRQLLRSCSQRPVIFLMLLASLALARPTAAQQFRDYRGIDARYFNPGREYQRYGATTVGQQQSGGNTPFGNYGPAQHINAPGFYGSASATYSDGRMLVGVARTPAGVLHLSNGLWIPALVPGPAFGVAPLVGSYGSGFYGSGFPGTGAFGPTATPLAWTIDPFTGQLVPLIPAYGGSLPYFGGLNPYFPGSILSQTLINMNISMQPSVPSSAAFTMTDPRVLQLAAPGLSTVEVPGFSDPRPQVVAPRGPMVPEENVVPAGLDIPDAPPVPQPDQSVPLLNEFEAIPVGERISNLAGRINSLRYQSTGDSAFRKEDYTSAEDAYRLAIEMAPDRRSPYLRMAFALIARENFPRAVSYLKTALLLPDDATRTWISADELYGDKVAERARTHGSKLWNWLAERPLSSDRLLLSGAFQKLRGYDDAAEELLSMAAFHGPEANYVSALKEIVANDIGQRGIAHELDQLMKTAPDAVRDDAGAVAGKSAQTHDAGQGSNPDVTRRDGIFLRGASADAQRPAASNQLPQGSLPGPELFIPPADADPADADEDL